MRPPDSHEERREEGLRPSVRMIRQRTLHQFAIALHRIDAWKAGAKILFHGQRRLRPHGIESAVSETGV
jgi:hypothetical protein